LSADEALPPLLAVLDPLQPVVAAGGMDVTEHVEERDRVGQRGIGYQRRDVQRGVLLRRQVRAGDVVGVGHEIPFGSAGRCPGRVDRHRLCQRVELGYEALVEVARRRHPHRLPLNDRVALTFVILRS